MALDPYALCPCGSGKKLKFCCFDLAPEMDKVLRMLEGDQHSACLAYLERLTEKHPDRASLLGLKTLLQSSLGKLDEAQVTIDHFLAKHPGHPVALAELAIVTAFRSKGREAVAVLQQLIETLSGSLPSRAYQAIGDVAGALLRDDEVFAGLAHLRLQVALSGGKDPQPLRVLMHLGMAPQLPLPLKDHWPLSEPPAEAPWKAPFEQALDLAHRAHWQKAAEQFSALVEQHPDAAPAWRNLGLLRGWLSDPAAAKALHRYASLEVPLEDAVDIEELAQLLSRSQETDSRDVVRFTYPVQDLEQVLPALQDSPRTSPLPLEADQLEVEEGPPPQALYWLLDRPLPSTGAGLTLETAPLVLGRLYLFGRQTDREARLELLVTDNGSFPAAQQAVRELAGAHLVEPGEPQVVGQVSALSDALSWKWRLPDDTPAEVREELILQRRKLLVREWLDMPQATLGNKSVRQVAGEPAGRVAALAAIQGFEIGLADPDSHVDFNELRQELGLPIAGEIDPAGVDVEQVPTARLGRFAAGKMTDEQLLGAFQRLAGISAPKAVKNIVPEVLRRETVSGQINKAEAYGLLAQFESDADEQRRLFHEARQADEAQGQSTARWDLAELELCLQTGNVDEGQQLLRRITREHMQEPGIAERLYQILQEYGIIGPDGRPAGPPPEAHQHVVAGASGSTEGSGTIWTPGSESGGEKKLWTPGMD